MDQEFTEEETLYYSLVERRKIGRKGRKEGRKKERRKNREGEREREEGMKEENHLFLIWLLGKAAFEIGIGQ